MFRRSARLHRRRRWRHSRRVFGTKRPHARAPLPIFIVAGLLTVAALALQGTRGSGSDSEKVAASLSDSVDALAVPSEGAVGGGGAPGVALASAAVSLPSQLADPLRQGTPPVVGHVRSGRLLLDLLAVHPDDDAVLVSAVRRALTEMNPAEPPCT